MVAKISFVGVKTEFEPVPAGLYDGEFFDFKMGKTGDASKVPGSDKMNLQFAITEEGEYRNRRVFRTCTFTPESLWVFKRTMSALGAEPNWEDENGIDVEEIARSVLHVRCLLKLSIREYKDDADIDPETGEGRVKYQNNLDDVLPTEATQAARVEEVAASGRKR